MSKIFADYNFEDENYSIEIKRMGGSSELLISEKSTLKMIKEKWDFNPTDSIGRCGYDYNLEIRKDGQLKDNCLMCFSCNTLSFEGTNPWRLYRINPDFIENFMKMVKDERL